MASSALPSELRSSLPSSIDPAQVRAAVRSPGSQRSLGGETWLLDLGGRLAVLVRESIFDPLAAVALADAQPVTLHEGPRLEIRTADGASFEVRPSVFEIEAVTALLAAVDGAATLPEPEPEPAVIAEAPARAPDSVTLADLDVIDPNLETEVAEALAADQADRAIAAARELARSSTPQERDEWNDLIEVVEVLRSSDCVAAYLWTRGVRKVPPAVTDALFASLARKLEARAEPALAWAAYDQLLVDESGPEQRKRIEDRLGRDGPTLAREVAARAREFFAPLAEAGDRRAQRGLAQALVELDELDDALSWVRRAIAAERFDFDARMLETRILALEAIERGDDRELLAALQKAADDFHDRPEPLVDLADHVEFDDSVWAIDSLRKAQERQFDEFVLVQLVELLASSKRWSEVIREVERALEDPDAVELVEDQLREQLATARAALALSPVDSPRTPATRAASEQAPVNATMIVVLVAVAVLAVLMAVMF